MLETAVIKMTNETKHEFEWQYLAWSHGKSELFPEVADSYTFVWCQSNPTAKCKNTVMRRTIMNSHCTKMHEWVAMYWKMNLHELHNYTHICVCV